MTRIKNYKELLEQVDKLITRAKTKIARNIDVTQTVTYWLIGKMIIEHEQGGCLRAKYGKRVLVRLSVDLLVRFGRGFSEDNLENMRRFYMGFPKLFKISETVSRKSIDLDGIVEHETPSRILSWSNYCELLKEEDQRARTFYEIEAAENGWSTRELRRQMDSMLYERLCLSKNKKKVMELSRLGQIIERPEDAVKDPYVLEFLGLKEEAGYTESQFEQAAIGNLAHFLLEMGKGFIFVARQKRITITNRHYFIDLVLYNRFLKCFVLVDFKRGELTHADAGQMNFYLNYFRENEMSAGENPPIGIILCSKKDAVYSKYVLGNLNNKVFASKYKLALPSEKELDQKLRTNRG